MCLCPSVAQTPILSGCSEAEIAKMKEDVGGLMSPEFVAEALLKLLEDEKNGAVMAAWNKVPPYHIPDTGMALFILFTTTAMIARCQEYSIKCWFTNVIVSRYIPGVRVVRPWLMVIIVLGIVGSWYLGGLLLAAIYQFIADFL